VRGIGDVGWVGDDEINRCGDASERVAFHEVRFRQSAHRPIGARKIQGDRVDVCQHGRRDQSARGDHGANAGACADIGKARAGRQVGQRLAEEAREAVGVRAEEDGVVQRGREGGVDEEVVVQA
jgi:hypothetical protein